MGIREYDIFDVKGQDVSDINQLWLNRNTLFSDGEYDYIYPKKGEVRDAWGGSISSVDFKVEVISKAEYQNPLTIEFNKQLLYSCGFTKVDIFWKDLNFIGFIVQK